MYFGWLWWPWKEHIWKESKVVQVYGGADNFSVYSVSTQCDLLIHMVFGDKNSVIAGSVTKLWLCLVASSQTTRCETSTHRVHIVEMIGNDFQALSCLIWQKVEFSQGMCNKVLQVIMEYDVGKCVWYSMLIPRWQKWFGEGYSVTKA